MEKINRYAPVLHTGFFEKHRDGAVSEYAAVAAARGYSGISLEGKSRVPTDDIDKWIKDYHKNVQKMKAAAEEQGIDIWLFDEWGYPSGTAAGRVIAENRDYASKTLRLILDIVIDAGESFDMPVGKRFIAAAAWQESRKGSFEGYTELIPKNGRLHCCAENGALHVAAVAWEYTSGAVHGVFCDDGRAEYGTIDLLSYKAVQCFIKHMHEGYCDSDGKLNGIAGFFYDEPFAAYPYPYTSDIFDLFKARYGYDIVPYLPQILVSGWGGGKTEHMIIDYRELVTELIADNFVGQLQKWCHAHGVLLTGHQDLDHSLRGLNTVSGDFFKNSVRSDSPGVDYIWNQINKSEFCDHPRFAGSVKNLCGKAHATSESFAVTGYSMSPDEILWHMEHQIMRGIDLFFLMIAEPEPEHQSEYTCFSLNNPMNELFGKELNERIAEVNRLAVQGRAGADTAVYLPMHEAFLQGHKSAHPWMTSTMPHIWNRVSEIARAVCYAPRAYEYIWDDMICSMRVDNDCLVTETGQRISVLVLPGGVYIPEHTIAKIREFTLNGGITVIVGKSIEGLLDITETYQAIGCALLVPDVKTLEKYMRGSVFSGVGFTVSFMQRLTESGKICFLLNESDEYAWVNSEKALYEYSFHSKRFDKSVSSGRLRFAPGELRIFMICGEDKPCIEKQERELVIDRWTMYSPDGKDYEIGSSLADWREYIDPCYSGGVRLVSEFNMPTDCKAILDPGRVKYSAIVRIDGKEHKLIFPPYRTALELKAGMHSIEMIIYNTGANKLIGTYEQERKSIYSLRSGTYEHDRFRLGGGFIDEVRILY